MQQVYKVVKHYENSNTDPIELKIGDTVTLGERSEEDGQWANWIYCISNKTKKAGWEPTQILNMNGEIGIAILDYTAQELTITTGEIIMGSEELNGWIGCWRESDGQTGWVPKNCLEIVQSV